MEALFSRDKEDILKSLKSIEDEMKEAVYGKSLAMEMADISAQARLYIGEIVDYMKRTFAPKEINTENFLRELYRLAATEEYTCYQNIDEIGTEHEVFRNLKSKRALDEVRYAMHLVRYYYLIKERRMNPESVWRDITEVCEKFGSLREIGEIKEKKPVGRSADDSEINEENFMEKLMEHLNKYMIGQKELKKTICTVVYQWKYFGIRNNLLLVGPSGSGKNHIINTLSTFPGLGCGLSVYDCSQITSSGYLGNDIADIYKRHKAVCAAQGKSTKGSIIYLDEIDKKINSHVNAAGQDTNGFVQQEMLTSLEGTVTIAGVNTSEVLFILGGAFARIDDLKKQKINQRSIGFSAEEAGAVLDLNTSLRDQMREIGAEAEFINRASEIIEMQPLTREDLKAILLDTNIGAFAKKKKMFDASGLELEIEKDCVEDIVDLIEKSSAGARGVINIVNEFVKSRHFYDLKTSHYNKMIIHKGMLYGEPPRYERTGGKNDEKLIKCS